MTAPGSAVVRFDSVGKRYRLGRERVNLRPAMPGAWGANVQGNAHTALKDISFALAPGESLGIVGPNGAGKSTMLKLVAGVIAASSGSVKVRGRTAALIELGAGFHPDMTGRENIGFSAAVLGMSKKQLALRVDEIIAFADIGHYLDTPVKRYSSGMMARLGFAIASHLDVDVLVLDEVLAVGDASFQTRCHERILALRDTGCATLYVTHALWTLPLLCQRAILLGGGTVVAEGTPMHVLEAYRNQAGQRNNAVETPQGAQLWIHDITVTPPRPARARRHHHGHRDGADGRASGRAAHRDHQ